MINYQFWWSMSLQLFSTFKPKAFGVLWVYVLPRAPVLKAFTVNIAVLYKGINLVTAHAISPIHMWLTWTDNTYKDLTYVLHRNNILFFLNFAWKLPLCVIKKENDKIFKNKRLRTKWLINLIINLKLHQLRVNL
jgi:hypothetical protein